MLEDRRVLSTLLVAASIDEVPGSGSVVPSGPGQYSASSLRAAIEWANAHAGDDAIQFMQPLGGVPFVVRLTRGELPLTETLGTTRIVGLGQDQLTIDGQSASRVFHVSTGARAEISGLTVARGQTTDGGGGIMAELASSVKLSRVWLTGNQTNDGGGAVKNYGSLVVTDCAASENLSAGRGGAVLNYGLATIKNSLFETNTAANGGAIANLPSPTGPVGQMTMANCTFSNNSATNAGGAVLDKGIMELDNCTIAGNRADTGGGLRHDGIGYYTLLKNTIVAGNQAVTGLDVSGTVDLHTTLIQNPQGAATTPWSADVLAGDPHLLPLGNYGGATKTMPPSAGSMALDRGDNSLVPADLVTDQQGQPRISNGRVDLGAVEIQVATTLSVANATGVYGGAATLTATLSGGSAVGQVLTFAIQGANVGSATTNAQGVATLANVSLAGLGAGELPVSVSAASLGISGAGSLTIEKRALTITADNKTKVYGAAMPALTVTYSGFAQGETADSLATKPTVSTTATSASPAGTYPISAAGAASPNYTITYVSGTLTVSKAALTVTADDASKIYGDADPAFSVTYQGFVNGDSVASLDGRLVFTTDEPASGNAPAGAYAITPSGLTSPNYTIKFVEGTLTVDTAELTVTADDADKTYGDPDPDFSVTYQGFATGESAANLDGALVLKTNEPAFGNAPANAYTITPSGLTSDNYNIAFVAGKLTVNKRELTITADDKSKSYGAALPPLTATYVNLAPGDGPESLQTKPTITTTATATSPIGTYPISASGAASPNYLITYAEGTLTVDKAALKVIANNAAKTYGDADPAFSATYVGFASGETAANLGFAPLFDTTEPEEGHAPAGRYDILATGPALDNYEVTFAPGILIVNKRTVTITADSKTMTYGGDVPALTVTYSGLAQGETGDSLTTPPTVTSTATVASPVGTYPITAAGAASPNYSIAYAGGTLTVSKAILTVTADNASKTYGDPDPEFSVAYQGFADGDGTGDLGGELTLTTNEPAFGNAPANAYTITPAGLTSQNYSITFVTGRLTVNKRALTITANDKTKSYGAALPALTATYSGFVEGESADNLTAKLTITTTATATSPIGTYPISASGAASPNYLITYAEGTLTVDKAALKVIANNAAKTYGDADPAFSATYVGFASGETAANLGFAPLFDTTEPEEGHAPAGRYDILVSGPDLDNYEVTFVPGILTVNKRALSITADNKTKTYGNWMPALTVTYSGFVQGESADSLEVKPMVTTKANTGSPIGTYPITPAGAVSPNYKFTYVVGTLTVSKATPRVTVSSTANPSVYGQPIVLTAKVAAPPGGVCTGTVTFLEGSKSLAIRTLNASGSATFAVSNLALGKHGITVRYSGSTNCSAASGFLSQSVQNVALQPDPLAPGQQALFLGGTIQDDRIAVTQDTVQRLKVQFNCPTVKITRLFSNAVSRIVVYGGPGNDTIQIDSRITIPAWLFGGDGNDTLTPGGGPSLVLGGGANDTLRGGNGRSILIGGRGSDLLQGGKGDAILISGNTDYDCNDLALAAVLADWNTADGYAARVANLTATLDASTVHDDGAADTLQRGTGANWLFADLAAANLLGAKKSKIRFV